LGTSISCIIEPLLRLCRNAARTFSPFAEQIACFACPYVPSVIRSLSEATIQSQWQSLRGDQTLRYIAQQVHDQPGQQLRGHAQAANRQRCPARVRLAR